MINLTQIGTFNTGVEGAAEITAYDRNSQRLFVVNADADRVDVLDLSDPTNPTKINEIALTSGSPNSVAVYDGLVAVAVADHTETEQGSVAFFDTDGNFISSVEVGALPDMLTFTPDGSKVLVANEGEPDDDYVIDPEGSISIIDVATGEVTTASFTGFNDQKEALIASGVRIFGPDATVAQDLEPEYIAISADGSTAFVTLQENNAFAVVELATGEVTDVIPLGFKDHSLAENALDPSDEDEEINLGTFNNLLGMYQPDAIASYQVNGETYYITANEGDARDYDGFSEEERVEDVILDPTAFPDAATLQQEENLGRLKITNTLGDTDGDGDFDELYSYGGRSFSIWNSSGELVFDSGDEIAQITAELVPELFNSQDNDPEEFDSRSDDKGAEPEGVVTGVVDGKPYAFIGLERIGGVMVYDVSNPSEPEFVQYIRSEDDISPEGLTFIAAEDSPNEKPLLVVANEISGSTTVYEIENSEPTDSEFSLQLLHAADQEAGIPALADAPNFSAVLGALRDDYENTLVLSSGDAYIPGPFFAASETAFGAPGRADILIQNELGFQAIAFGNHEFDFGTGTVADLINPDEETGYSGALFPYLSANLDFSTDADLAPLVTEDGQEASTIANQIAGNTIITVNDEPIGVVGATTPTLPSISSPGDVTVQPLVFDSANPEEVSALAAEIQTSVDSLLAANPNLNKVVLLAHMQDIAIEEQLAELLTDVDIIVAGGSNTLLADETDHLRAGDEVDGAYPILKTAADGNPIAVVNTDGNYRYVGRLVVDFDAEGVIIPESIDPNISGAYATDEEGVAAVNGTPDPEIVEITAQLSATIAEIEGNIFGNTEVYLNGVRGDVRTQETNLGNLTADANLAIAKSTDDSVVISIKNGGGIRDDIGDVIVPPGATSPDEIERVPPPANELAGKEEGDISQLDIENSLRFNNELTLLTLTAQELIEVIEHGVSETEEGATPGRFPQVSGINFSFDADLPVGNRVVSLGVVDENGTLIDAVVQDGELVGDANRTFRIVTLNFLADGGDDYPFPQGDSANRVDLVTEDEDNPNPDSRNGAATFAPDGSEQDALAEFLAANFSETAFDREDTEPELDTRIQNLDFREDTVFEENGTMADLVISEIMYNPASTEDNWEWVEVYNPGTSDVDLSGYVIDDGNNTFLTAANIASGTVTVNSSAILYNADDVSAADFEAAWGTGINLVAVTNWNALALNNGGDTVSLWNSFTDYDGDQTTLSNVVDTVAYDDSGDWVADDGAGSIYLTDLAADNNDGTNWALSTPGATTPTGEAYTSATGGGNSGADVGSPGGELTVNPPETVAIYEIQGAAQTSPLEGQAVTTTGIVTAVDANGFYLQDHTGDGDSDTSDALFVFTDDTPSVAVGDELEVAGTVSEFTPGGASSGNLSTTQISGNPTITVVSSGNELPTATIIGEGGRVPPSENIDDDAFGAYEPATDGIDFFESVEGMRVTAQDTVAIAPTNRFGEIFTVVDGGAGATGISDRGTLNISPDDFNPEKVQIDGDSDVFEVEIPEVDTGAVLGDVTGVVSYGFGNFEIIPTEAFTATDATIEPEVSTITAGESQLTVASYNVLNLDPNDGDGDTDVANGRFEAIAEQIANNLNSPDIIGLQEIQDNSGSEDDGVTSADNTLQQLVDTIAAAGGGNYAFIDNSFITDGASGGQPGGNIRTAFLYRTDRVDVVENSIQTIGSQASGAAFDGARLPLVATFDFNGAEITVVNNHFSSKGGSAPILGTEQDFAARQEEPTVNGSLDERQAQAQAVKEYVDGLLASDPDANVVALGDLNEFEFISPVEDLLGSSLNNLVNTLPEDERYSFIFQGNSQLLDHILVSDSLTEGATFDIVHINSEFAETETRASDHDPLVASLEISNSVEVGETISGTGRRDSLVGGAGNDTIEGRNNRDTLFGAAGDDLLDGGSGNDNLDGGEDNDTLEGGNGRDTLFGAAGEDLLDGGRSNDTLNGGEGNDTLIGDRGTDILTGGAGFDTFSYNNISDRKDIITDFEVTEDTIDVSSIITGDSYQSTIPFADYVELMQMGADTVVKIDPNGDRPNRGNRPLTTLEDVVATDLTSDHFIFG